MQPTPALYRKLGDALLAISTTITAYAIADEIKWLSLSALFIGVAGKFLSNFFTGTKTK